MNLSTNDAPSTGWTFHDSFWRRESGHFDKPLGAFGENLAIAGGNEQQACIGDIGEVDAALVQVAQPRRLRCKGMAA